MECILSLSLSLSIYLSLARFLSLTWCLSPYLSFCGLQIHKEWTVSAEYLLQLWAVIGPEEGVEVNRRLQWHRESLYNTRGEGETTQKNRACERTCKRPAGVDPQHCLAKTWMYRARSWRMKKLDKITNDQCSITRTWDQHAWGAAPGFLSSISVATWPKEPVTRSNM